MKDLVIKAGTLKKVVYIIPYILLIGIIIFQYTYYNGNSTCADITEEPEDSSASENSVSQNSGEEDISSEEKSLKETVEEENKEEKIEDEPAEEVKEETVEEKEESSCTPSDSTDPEIKIIKITTYKKTETFAKVTKVKFSISNPDEEFYPLVKFQIVGDESEREIDNIPKIEEDCKFVMESTLPNLGLSYTDIEDEKRLTGTLYKGSNIIDSTTAKFTTTQ